MNQQRYPISAQASINGRHLALSSTLRKQRKTGGVRRTPTIELGEIYNRHVRELVAFARRWGYGREDAEDLTQEFFLRLAEKGSLKAFDSTKGQFRSFLLTVFQRFLSNQWHSLHAVRRGGATVTLPLASSEDGEKAFMDWTTPEKVAHLHWARLLLEHAFDALREDLARQGKARLFDALLPHLLRNANGTSYATAAARVGLSAAAARMTVSRYRERLRVLICREFEGNGWGSRYADEEIRLLLEMLDQQRVF